MCINAMAVFQCGFTEANPLHVIPDWKITTKADNSNIVNTFYGQKIVQNLTKGLTWKCDLENSFNNRLLVGPVNRTLNGSTYQCMSVISNGTVISSSIGTMTVVGKSRTTYVQ